MFLNKMKGAHKINISELSKPKISRWLFNTILDWAIIISLMIAAIKLNHPVVYILSVFIIGSRQHALAIMGHDGAHYAACENRQLNDIMASVFVFWPLGIGINGYRKFHFAHHKKVGTPEDPELILKRLSRPQWELPAKNSKHITHLIKDLFGISYRELFKISRSIKSVGKIDIIGPVTWWLVMIVTLFYFGQYIPLILWFASVFTSYWAVFRLRVWFEHQGTTETNRVHAVWWQKLIFAPHNVWYHYEHHLFPSVPFYNLDKVRNMEKGKSIISVGELFRSFRVHSFLGSGRIKGA